MTSSITDPRDEALFNLIGATPRSEIAFAASVPASALHRQSLPQPTRWPASSTTSSRTTCYPTTPSLTSTSARTANAVNATCATKPVLSDSISSPNPHDHVFLRSRAGVVEHVGHQRGNTGLVADRRKLSGRPPDETQPLQRVHGRVHLPRLRVRREAGGDR